MSVPIDPGGALIANPIQQTIILPLMRYTTDWFIKDCATIAGPINIALQRQISVAKPGGGHDFQIVTLPPQTFRLVNQTISDGINYSSNDDGMARRDNYVLIGSYDADIQANDTWQDSAGQYKVDGLLPSMGYEIRAAVTAFTTEPDYGS
jgi:hypothetical protein